MTNRGKNTTRARSGAPKAPVAASTDAIPSPSTRPSSTAARPFREEFSASFKHLDMTTARGSSAPLVKLGSDRAARRTPTPVIESARPSPISEPSTRPTLSWQKTATDRVSGRSAAIPAASRTANPDDPAPSGPPGVYVRRRLSEPSEADNAEVRVKGINFTSGLEAIQRIYGAAARTRIEKETTGRVGDALRFGGIVAGGWYSAAWYRDFLNSVRINLGADESTARNIGRFATEVSVHVAYRALARLTTPSQLLGMSERAFGHYFERCSLSVSQPEPNRLTSKWRDCNGFNSMIWHVVEGGCVYFIEAAGGKDVTFSVISGGDDANHMLASATWR